MILFPYKFLELSLKVYVIRVKITQAIHETLSLQTLLVETYAIEGAEGLKRLYNDQNNLIPNYDSDVVSAVDVSYFNGNKTNEGIYFSYQIHIKSEEIGLESILNQSYPPEYRTIGVAFAIGKAAYINDQFLVVEADDFKGPFCGQTLTSKAEAKSFNIPRRYLPIACRDSGTRPPYDGIPIVNGAVDF